MAGGPDDRGPPRLGDILVARGLASSEGVEAALQASGGKLASQLFRLGVVRERALALGLAEQRNLPVLVLSESTIELSTLELVPRALAEAHGMLPVAVDAETITLAVSHVPRPGERRPEIFERIEFASGRRVVLVLAVEAVIAEGIAATYEAHRAGRTSLSGTSSRPAEIPASEPLSFARPPVPGSLADPLTVAPPRAPIAPSNARLQLLAVDDDDDIRTLMKKVLSYDGYDVVEARTGREALEILRTLRPAVILLDAMLPEIHGFDICAQVKRSGTFENTSVVVVSALYRGWEHARTVQEMHGADAFIEKPFDVHYLRQLVARLVGRQLPKNVLSPEWQKKLYDLRDDAQIAFQLGDYAGAEDAVKRWRGLDPFDANSWLFLGNIRTKTGDMDGAMKAFERAATFDGTLFPAFRSLAVIYEELGFAQRSRMAWHRALELAPNADARQEIETHLAQLGHRQ